MSKNTSVSVASQSNSLVFNGAADFTHEEIEIVKSKLGGDLKLHMEVMNRDYLQLDAAMLDLQMSLTRAQRRLRDTKEFQQVQALRSDLRILKARRDELRTKAHGIFEAALGSVQRGKALYKKLAMLLSSQEG